MRSNASTSSALLGSLQNGTQLQVVETVELGIKFVLAQDTDMWQSIM